jgi:hypothetical protein
LILGKIKKKDTTKNKIVEVEDKEDIVVEGIGVTEVILIKIIIIKI